MAESSKYVEASGSNFSSKTPIEEIGLELDNIRCATNQPNYNEMRAMVARQMLMDLFYPDRLDLTDNLREQMADLTLEDHVKLERLRVFATSWLRNRASSELHIQAAEKSNFSMADLGLEDHFKLEYLMVFATSWLRNRASSELHIQAAEKSQFSMADLATSWPRNKGSSGLHIQAAEKSHHIDIDGEVWSPDPVIPQPKSKLSEWRMALVILGIIDGGTFTILAKELQGFGTALMPKYYSRTILGLLALSLSCLFCIGVFYKKLPTKFANIATRLAFACNTIAFFTLVTFYMGVI